MRPSHYNYMKRAFTRNMANRGESIIKKIILFPFRVCIFVFLTMLYVGFLVLYYGTLIVLKILFELLKLFFKFLKSFFIGLVLFAKDFYKKNYYKTPKEKKEEKIKRYAKKSEEANITDIMQKFDVSSSEAIRILSEK